MTNIAEVIALRQLFLLWPKSDYLGSSLYIFCVTKHKGDLVSFHNIDNRELF